MRAQTYEITFLGQANSALRAEFEDCEVTVGHGTTTLRADFPDQGALSGLIERISSLRLDVNLADVARIDRVRERARHVLVERVPCNEKLRDESDNRVAPPPE